LFVSRFQRRLGEWHEVIALATQTEADRFSALTGLPALWLPLPLLRSASADVRAVADRGTQILFIGDWNHPLNRLGLDFFLARVMPDVWSRYPAIRLVVAGKGSDELALPASAGPIRVWGRYGDLTEIAQGSMTVGVLPLLEPLGIRTRLFELLACGMPVVATEQAVDGIAMGAGLVTAPLEGFAQALIELLDSPQRLRETAEAALEGTGATWPSDEECAARWAAAFDEARTHSGTKA
jgi:glycosyltransferase involved in cell wall biosynthesis